MKINPCSQTFIFITKYLKMKYLFLALALTMFSAMTLQAQEKKEKEVIIIRTSEDGKDVQKRIIKKEFSGVDMSDKQIDSLIQSIMKDANGSVEDIDIDIKKINGKENKIIKIVTKGDKSSAIKEGDGIFVLDLEDEMIDEEFPKTKVRMGIMLGESVKILELIKDGPADKAGFKEGDKIQKIDQQIIYSYRGLMEHLSSFNPGDRVSVEIIRGGNKTILNMTLDAKK